MALNKSKIDNFTSELEWVYPDPVYEKPKRDPWLKETWRLVSWVSKLGAVLTLASLVALFFTSWALIAFFVCLWGFGGWVFIEEEIEDKRKHWRKRHEEHDRDKYYYSQENPYHAEWLKETGLDPKAAKRKRNAIKAAVASDEEWEAAYEAVVFARRVKDHAVFKSESMKDSVAEFDPRSQAEQVIDRALEIAKVRTMGADVADDEFFSEIARHAKGLTERANSIKSFYTLLNSMESDVISLEKKIKREKVLGPALASLEGNGFSFQGNSELLTESLARLEDLKASLSASIKGMVK